MAIIGIPIIVGVFALLYVNTFIDPFERMKSVPIAVISEDAGAYVDGEYKNYGDELVDSICENDSAKWTVEDASLIDDGLREAISGTNMQVAYCDAGMLLLFAAGATALSLITYPAALKMKKKMEGYSAAALAAAAE